MLYCYLKKCFAGTIVIMLLLLQNSFAAATGPNGKTLPDSIKGMVKGIVLDDYGHPLENVKIIIKGGSTRAVSDHKGNFNIAANVPATLFFNQPGFYTCKLVVKDNANVTVKLKQSYLQQPDTLDVLYGQTLADNSLGAISTIYTDQLTTTPSDTYAPALTGRLAGLYSYQYNGFPIPNTNAVLGGNFFGAPIPNEVSPGSPTVPTDNSEIAINIRGQNPITVVDGIQREFYSIDPEDIASVSILKDGLSTLLLGQSSSRPVLLVTTKRALPGPPRISFTAQTGFASPVALPQPLPAYQYAYLLNEARENNSQPPLYTAADIQAYQDGSDPTGHPNVNWFNTVLNQYAPITRYNLIVGGGSTYATYNVSLGYLDQRGLFKTSAANTYNTNDEVQRYLVTSNVEITPAKNLTVGLNLLGRIQDDNEPGATSGGLFYQLYNTPNNASPVFNPNGSPGGTVNFPSNLYDRTVNSGYIATYDKDIVADLNINYKFTNWLPGLYVKIKGNFSVLTANDVNRSQSNKTYDYVVANGDTTITSLGSSTAQSNAFSLTSSTEYVYGQAMLGYDGQFGKNGVSASVFTDTRSVTLSFNLPYKSTNYAVTGSYNYDNKYLAQAAINYSGYDQFAPGHQFGFFYGGGLGWKIAEESFIKDNAPWINKLKLRVTYAKTGNDNVGYFVWRQGYSVSGFGFGGDSFGAGVYNNDFGGLTENTLANENATWEKAHKFDAGLDMGFLNNHLQATADYYNDTYYDLMQNLASTGRNSALIGATYSPENIGTNRFSGAELTVTYQNTIGKVNYFITGNASLIASKVVYMDEINRPNSFNVRTGQPVGELFGYIADGLFQTQAQAAASPKVAGYTPQPGDIRYKNIGGPNGHPDTVIDQFDQAPIMGNNPLIWYGATIGFNYKGFDMSVLFEGVAHRSIYTGVIPTDNTFAGGDGQAYTMALGRWTPETAATAIYPELTPGANLNNQSLSSYWVHSGDYISLKNLDLGYTLPNRWAKKLKVGSIRVFANGLNLLTFTPYSLVALEESYSGTNYPTEKVFNIGFNIKL